MKIFYKVVLGVSGCCFFTACILLLSGYSTSVIGPLVIGMFVGLALGVRGTRSLFKSFAFSLWIFASVSLAMFYPDLITDVGGVNTAVLIVPLINVILIEA